MYAIRSYYAESADSEFTWENFQVSVNKDLADVLGNFVSRITKFCRSKFGEALPEGGTWGEREEALISELTTRIADYERYMDDKDVRKAAAASGDCARLHERHLHLRRARRDAA